MTTTDFLVVGGGIIGIAIARELRRRNPTAGICVLEKEAACGLHASGRNSGVIHAGFYYSANSLKARLTRAGNLALTTYSEERKIPVNKCGKLVVASSEAEVGYLEKLLRQAQANGVDDCGLIDRDELARLEPQIRGFTALMSPSTGIIDSHQLMEAYVTDIEAHGGSIVLNSPVLGGEFLGDAVRLSIGGRDPVEIESRLVVNAAGLNAWAVSESIAGLDQKTVPGHYYAKGCYFSLAGRAPASRLIYPVPEPGGLGVHLTIDLAGQPRFGPDVEWVDTIDYDVDSRRADTFYAAIRRYWPALPDGALQPAYSGMRPKIIGPDGGGGGDFVIQGPDATGHPAYAALYGIESPGLTASLAIAERVRKLT